MTDSTANSPLSAGGTSDSKSSLFVKDARTKKRNFAESRFKAYGLGAIIIGVVFLLLLLSSILRNGLPAFTQTTITVNLALTAEAVETAEASLFKTKEYEKIAHAALAQSVSEAGIQHEMSDADLGKILSGTVGNELRQYALANRDSLDDEPIEFKLHTSSRVDGYLKGRVTRDALARDKNLDAVHLDITDELVAEGTMRKSFNWNFVFGHDTSDERPEGSGMGAAMLGSLALMLTVLGLCLPISVAAAIYLEEFAPKNKLTDFIEVNISNLAAVPSIVYGILALAVFIQFAGLPRSAPLVGGLALTLMTLPTIIISTRAALKAVPPSIRDAALGLGASKMQSVFHHVLPLAMPGIMTGTIIGLAAALGETAPLLLIGMVGLIATSYPSGPTSLFLDPNAAMPAQIYVWAQRADPAWFERAWGGIIILLVFLMTMNIVAIILRRRFERRW